MIETDEPLMSLYYLLHLQLWPACRKNSSLNIPQSQLLSGSGPSARHTFSINSVAAFCHLRVAEQISHGRRRYPKNVQLWRQTNKTLIVKTFVLSTYLQPFASWSPRFFQLNYELVSLMLQSFQEERQSFFLPLFTHALKLAL